MAKTNKTIKMISERKYKALQKKFNALKAEHKEMVDGIKGVLHKYFEYDGSTPNPEFDEDFSAQEAIDEIEAYV